jgi:ABC-type phosphate transport system substrate-binding protein
MSNKIARFMTFFIVVSATAGFMVSANSIVEQVVNAQNTTTNSTNSTNSAGSTSMPPAAAPSSTEWHQKWQDSRSSGVCNVSTC